MHQSALRSGAAFFAAYGQYKVSAKVVDIGSLNVNGSLKDVCPTRFEYVGVDFAEGAGVDVVLKDPYVLPFGDETADVVVCSSCFEHSEMFWLAFLEAVRILKPDGLLYLNVPSNGLFHRYPVDCWRFYPDSGRALATWANRSGYPVALLESFISRQQNDSWNDFVAVFVKDAAYADSYPARISDTDVLLYNACRAGDGELKNFQDKSEDQEKIEELYRQLGGRDAKIERFVEVTAAQDEKIRRLERTARELQERLAACEQRFPDQGGPGGGSGDGTSKVPAGQASELKETPDLHGEQLVLSLRDKQIDVLEQALAGLSQKIPSLPVSWRVMAPVRLLRSEIRFVQALVLLLYCKLKREYFRIIGNADKRGHYATKLQKHRRSAARAGSLFSRFLRMDPGSARRRRDAEPRRSFGDDSRRGYLAFKLVQYKLRREYYRLTRNTSKFNHYSFKVLQCRAQAVQTSSPERSSLPAMGSFGVVQSVSPHIQYVPLNNTPLTTASSARLICFYLPQFHAIPENDTWWEKGFTEWTNVRPARPQFEGHYQPHVPGELGYYDLLDPAVQRRQVELAKLYGVHGFCFYFYWFNGKRLLEGPTENYLNDRSLELPFCLCWANENWSRRWDGREHEVLIAQNHCADDDIAFITHVSKYLRDERYIRVNGKPLLLVYRPELLPSASETANRWRQWCRDNGIGEIYLAYTQSFERVDPARYGFDAAIEFPPNSAHLPKITGGVASLSDGFAGAIYEWRELVSRSQHYSHAGYRLFRSVCPAWDNTARRRNLGTVLLNSSPELYRHWLENAVRDTERATEEPSERLVFANAWNEWAEGAHLEPDQRYGYAYLQATREALSYEDAILLVTHDCHPHGAQLLTLEMAKRLKSNGYKVLVLALDGGVLLDEFAQLGITVNAQACSADELERFLAQVRSRGVRDAITSTVVSGAAVPRLKAHGFRVLSLIHELPGVIRDMRQEANAEAIAQLSDKVVFPAEMVHRHFCGFVSVPPEKVVIRPQGVARRNPFRGRRAEARQVTCAKLGLPSDAKIVLGIGYLDKRKGGDLFVEMAAAVLKSHPDTYFVWVGNAEKTMHAAVTSRSVELGIADRLILADFDRDLAAYYAAASVYALTSREDPFPNVVLEAVDAGTPVVAFEGATGASDFVLEHGGRLAAAFDVVDFAGRVCELLERSPDVQTGRVGSLQQYVLDLLFELKGLPRVSVVVPNYNYAKYLQDRLDSICHQSFPIYELIVLDDASGDDSLQVIERYLEQCRYDTRLVANAENSGSVFSQWRKGVEHCSGDLVWIAEADDLAHNGFLRALVPAFADAEVVLAFTQSKQLGEHGELLASDYLAYTDDVCSRRWRSDYVCEGREEIRVALSVKNTIPNVSGVLFRRQALADTLKQVGEEVFRYRIAGDWMIYLQLLLRGKINFNATAYNLHRRHARGVTKSSDAAHHLREVKEMQDLARSLVAVSPEVRDKVDSYNSFLIKYFDLPIEVDATGEAV